MNFYVPRVSLEVPLQKKSTGIQIGKLANFDDLSFITDPSEPCLFIKGYVELLLYPHSKYR